MKNSLTIRDLRYQYPDGTPALHGIDLEVSDGERLGLIGANGAGKSTLLLHLNGILRGEGDIEVAGLALSKKNLPEIRARVGLVFQNPDDQLFSPTVFDDVAFGPLQNGVAEAELEPLVQEALGLVGLKGFEHRNPHHLSLGEKKRAALSSILVLQPSLLVLDEPTNGLDPRGRRELIALLGTLSTTQLVASHDLELIGSHCTRIVVLDGGEIVGDGEPPVILGDREFLLKHGLA